MANVTTCTNCSPCPFCGSTNVREDFVLNTQGNVRFMDCLACSARGPWSKRGEAEAKWNARYTPSETRFDERAAFVLAGRICELLLGPVYNHSQREKVAAMLAAALEAQK